MLYSFWKYDVFFFMPISHNVFFCMPISHNNFMSISHNDVFCQLIFFEECSREQKVFCQLIFFWKKCFEISKIFILVTEGVIHNFLIFHFLKNVDFETYLRQEKNCHFWFDSFPRGYIAHLLKRLLVVKGLIKVDSNIILNVSRVTCFNHN